MIKKFINTFHSGIDRDTVVTKYSDSNVFACENMRVISNHELSSGALLSIKGNLAKGGLSGTGVSILGHCVIRDWAVIFVKTDSGGRIYKFWDSGADGQDDDDKFILMYSNPDLIFSTDYPIRAIGRYENELVQKVYFTDTTSFFYHLNVAGETQIDETEVPIEALDIVSDITFSDIECEIISGGNLKAGRIQYSYQLYNTYGAESMFSPSGTMINLTSSDDNNVDTINYNGSKAGEFVNKSVRVVIDISDPAFDTFTRLRLVAIFYEDDVSIPDVRIVGEYNIDDIDEFSATDTGQTINKLTLEEFRFVQKDIVPKTLETKNNHLFIGNITEDTFYISDEVFDARAFRFNNSATPIAVLNDVFTGHIVSSADIEGTLPGLLDACFCPYNDLDNNSYVGTDSTKVFKYKSDGVTLGGTGIHMEYEFISKNIILDNQSQSAEGDYTVKQYGTYNYPYQITNVSGEYNNYSRYLTAGENAGFQRDETYSFAIVFYDNKGRASFAKWIADIRFPNQDEYPFISYDAAREITYGSVLGIVFKMTAAGKAIIDGLSNVTSWQIVRCERNDYNKTVKAAGISSYLLDGSRNGDTRLYACATIPTVYDNINRRIMNQRWTFVVPGTSDAVVAVENEATTIRLNEDYVEFSSPEISFYKNLSLSDSDYFEVVGALNTLSYTAIVDKRTADGDRNDNFLISDKYRNFVKFTSTTGGYPSTIASVATSKILRQMTNSSEPGYVVNSFKIYSKRTYNIKSNNPDKNYGLRGTHLFAETLDRFDDLDTNTAFGGAGDIRVMYTYYRQNKARGIYGGTDYSARTGRSYYKASEVIDKARTTSTVTTTSLAEVTNVLGTGTDEILDQTLVSFTNTLDSGGYVGWDIVVDLPVVTIADTAFTVEWTAYRTDVHIGNTDFSTVVTVPLGGGSNSVTVTDMLEGISTESWTITEARITAFTPNTQYIISDPNLVGTTTTVTETESTIDGIIVYGGDTYLGYMIEYRSLWDDAMIQVNHDTSRGREIVVIVMYPVESTINLNLRLDDIQRFIPWTANVDVLGPYEDDGEDDNGMPKYQIQERLVDGISLFPKGYPQELGDLYRYNRAYSAMDKSKVFMPEPFDFVDTKVYDTRIYHSLPKTNGEYIDSWLKFLAANYIDVESEFGELERLININGRVMFLQNTGVGVLSVNDRSLVKDNNIGTITLGVGGVLNRYDYVSFTSGIDRHDAAVGSDETLYYVDAERKRIYMIGEGDIPISAVKGVNSLLKKLDYTKIVTGYDPEFAEVFFTIDDTTLTYGEFQKAFLGTQSFAPESYITIGNKFYTVSNEGEEVPLLANSLTTVNWDFPDDDYILVSDGTTGGTIYKHNVGPSGEFYGGISGAEAFVELIINPENKQVCSFNTLDFRMEVIDINDEEVSTDDTTYPWKPIFETIKQVVFSNSYQTSTVDVVYGQNIKKIGKVWRMQVPLFADTKVGTRSTRYVDTYLRVKIIFDSSTANRLRLHDITTYYAPVKV